METQTCTVTNCPIKAYGWTGYCNRHYKQVKRYGFVRRTGRDKNEIRIFDGYCEIDIYNNKAEVVAIGLFDLKDLDFVKTKKWSMGSRGYINDSKKQSMHRYFIEVKDGLETDHINNIRTDNRRSNLRAVTHKENSRNRKSWSGNGFKGVEKQHNRWQAHIVIDGRKVLLSRHDTAIEAAQAYDTAAKEHFGEHANLNFKERI